MAGVAPLAPPARLRRDRRWEASFEARANETAWDLEASFSDAARGRALAESRLVSLRAALYASPYWRAVFRRIGASPEDLRALSDLPHFPELSRDALGVHAAEVLVDRAVEGLAAVRSSGTTGEPILVPKDPYDQLHPWAVLRFWLGRLGVALPQRPRVVLLDALPGGLEYSVRLALVRGGALHRVSLVDPARALRRLARLDVSVLASDPAGLHWLAANPRACAPRLVLTSAQRFSPAQRAALGEVVRAPVVNVLSTTETGPIAWECLRVSERFHVLVPDVWCESVDGRLLVTRLRESALPLLRYETGDAAALVHGPCVCGFEGPSLVHFEGRSACWFVREDGEKFDAWQLAWLFKHHALSAFQLTQRSPRDFTLWLAARPASVEVLLQSLRDALARLGIPGAAIELVPEPVASGPKPAPFVQTLR